MSHSSLAGLDRDAFFREVSSVQGIVEELAGPAATRCLRPPYGATDSFTRAYAAELGYAIVLWDIDPRDWARPEVEKLTASVLEGTGPGKIILLQDGGGDRSQTVAALQEILAALSAAGYAFKGLQCA
jgi:peptidoglycan/xylan/chitin deacetylase (PgdA/CDA1 family)